MAIEIILILAFRVLKGRDVCEACVNGAASLLPCLLIVISAFFLQEANSHLGLTEFVIYSVEPIMSAAILPVVVFVVVSFIAF